MILLFEKISESSLLTTVLILMELVSIHVMKSRIAAMDAYGGAPDVWFAYQPQQLADWLANMTDEGCVAYHRMSQWDLFPYMECYTLLLGSLLLQQARAAGLADSIAMIFPLVMIMDIIETTLPAWGCDRRALGPHGLTIAAAANKYKWVLFGTGMCTLSVLFVYNTLVGSKPQTKEEVAASDKDTKKKK